MVSFVQGSYGTNDNDVEYSKREGKIAEEPLLNRPAQSPITRIPPLPSTVVATAKENFIPYFGTLKPITDKFPELEHNTTTDGMKTEPSEISEPTHPVPTKDTFDPTDYSGIVTLVAAGSTSYPITTRTPEDTTVTRSLPPTTVFATSIGATEGKAAEKLTKKPITRIQGEDMTTEPELIRPPLPPTEEPLIQPPIPTTDPQTTPVTEQDVQTTVQRSTLPSTLSKTTTEATLTRPILPSTEGQLIQPPTPGNVATTPKNTESPAKTTRQLTVATKGATTQQPLRTTENKETIPPTSTPTIAKLITTRKQVKATDGMKTTGKSTASLPLLARTTEGSLVRPPLPATRGPLIQPPIPSSEPTTAVTTKGDVKPTKEKTTRHSTVAATASKVIPTQRSASTASNVVTSLLEITTAKVAVTANEQTKDSTKTVAVAPLTITVEATSLLTSLAPITTGEEATTTAVAAGAPSTVTDINTTTPLPITTEPRMPTEKFTTSSSVSTEVPEAPQIVGSSSCPRGANALFGFEGDVYVINSGRITVLYKNMTSSRPIDPGNAWPGSLLPADGAYYRKSDGAVITFHKNRYRTYRNKVQIGGEEDVQRFGLPEGVSPLGVVTSWSGTPYTYFFNGGKYWRFNEERRQVYRRYFPYPISNIWRGLPNYLDAGILAPNGHTYFVKGSLLYKIQRYRARVMLGYPKPFENNCFELFKK